MAEGIFSVLGLRKGGVRVLARVEFDPRNGYPAGEHIAYQCLRCGARVPSRPVEFAACDCGNIKIDVDGGRVSVKDDSALVACASDGGCARHPIPNPFLMIPEGKQMNRSELQRRLVAQGIRGDAVCFAAESGSDAEQYCIGLRADGMWEVYYAERGQKGGLTIFATEDAACAHLLSILEIDGSVWSRLREV